MIRILLALAALLLFAPMAQAASFDCAKAATSFEKAICAHPDLSDGDEVLAQAYATALGGLSKPAADEMKANQHGWLDYAGKICSEDGTTITAGYTDDQAQCLVGTFASRVGDLEGSRMLGGYRFYTAEGYLVEKDQDAIDNDYTPTVAEKHFSTVKIDRDTDVAKAFNAMTESLKATYSSLFKPGTDELATGDTTEDVDVTTTVKEVTTYRITLSTNNYSYGHGAAHGNYGISYAHFLIGEKRPLEATDIFAGDEWQAKLGKLVVDKVKAQLADGYFDDSEADIPKWAADPSRWDFSDAGLVVQFQPYEVASYADGAVTVTIPWDQLSDMMSEHGTEIATY